MAPSRNRAVFDFGAPFLFLLSGVEGLEKQKSKIIMLCVRRKNIYPVYEQRYQNNGPLQ